MSAALDLASINGSAGAAAGLAALAASLLPPGRSARKGSYSGLPQRPGAQSQPQRCRAAPGVPEGSKMRGKEEKSSLKGGLTLCQRNTLLCPGNTAPHGRNEPFGSWATAQRGSGGCEGCVQGTAGTVFGGEK